MVSGRKQSLLGRAIGRVLWRRLTVLKACQAVLSISCLPAVEAGPTDAEIPASLADIANLISVLEHPQLVVHISPKLVHPDHPSCH
jgi:hypothetical protein